MKIQRKIKIFKNTKKVISERYNFKIIEKSGKKFGKKKNFFQQKETKIKKNFIV